MQRAADSKMVREDIMRGDNMGGVAAVLHGQTLYRWGYAATAWADMQSLQLAPFLGWKPLLLGLPTFIKGAFNCLTSFAHNSIGPH